MRFVSPMTLLLSGCAFTSFSELDDALTAETSLSIEPILVPDAIDTCRPAVFRFEVAQVFAGETLSVGVVVNGVLGGQLDLPVSADATAGLTLESSLWGQPADRYSTQLEITAGDETVILTFVLDDITPVAFLDSDGDGQAGGVLEKACAGSETIEDCDDADPAVFVGAVEVVGDPVDDDCDGVLSCFEDADLDGHGSAIVTAGADCSSSGLAPDDDDCDDAAAFVYPGAPDRCDGVSNDCVSELGGDETDADGDGWLACGSYVGDRPEIQGGGDCAPSDPNRHPGAAEICDGIDQDCDGLVEPDELDLDADGFRACDDCDDHDAERSPGVVEVCDGKDNDCDGHALGEADADHDGVLVCEHDCDDADPSVFPGATEVCDGKDSDCTDGVPPHELDADGDQWSSCAGDCDDTNADRYPEAPEICDGEVNDCHGPLIADLGVTAFRTRVSGVDVEHTHIEDALDAVADGGELHLCEDALWSDAKRLQSDHLITIAGHAPPNSRRTLSPVHTGPGPVALQSVRLIGGAGAGVQLLGGAVRADGDLTLHDFEIDCTGAHPSPVDGGGIWVDGTAQLSDGSIHHCNAERGGAVYSRQNVSVDQVSFEHNMSSTGAGGALHAAGGILVKQSSFTANTAWTDGGGIYSTPQSVLRIENSEFLGCLASAGGGVYASDELDVTSTAFSQNTAGSGGGLDVRGASSLVDVTFTENTTMTLGSLLAGAGAGLSVSGSLTGQGLGFEDNRSVVDGAAFAIEAGGYADVTDLLVTGSTVQDPHGGNIVYVLGTLHLDGGEFQGNVGIQNSGIYGLVSSAGSITSVVFSGGEGVPLDLSGVWTVRQSTVQGNHDAATGALLARGDILVEHSVFEDNTADASAGAVRVVGDLTMSDSSVRGNRVLGSGSGGGLNVLAAGTAWIERVDFVDNAAVHGAHVRALGHATLVDVDLGAAGFTSTGASVEVDSGGTVAMFGGSFSDLDGRPAVRLDAHPGHFYGAHILFPTDALVAGPNQLFSGVVAELDCYDTGCLP